MIEEIMVAVTHPLVIAATITGLFFLWFKAKKLKREAKLSTAFQGKVVWITGASSGIGRELALEFSRKQAILILSGRNVERLHETQEMCAQFWPDPIVAHQFIRTLELDYDESNERLLEKTKDALRVFDTLGRVDVFVNNAGVSSRGSVVDTDMETLERIMKINFTSPVALIKGILPSMISRGQGHIIAISSVQGLFALPYRSPYSASKHALQAFIDSLRAEVSSDGIKVLCVSPGWVRTSLSKNALDADGQAVGTLDANGAAGMEPEYLAKLVVEAAANDDRELVVAQLSGYFARYLRTLVPDLFFSVMDRRGRQLKETYSKPKVE